MSDTMKTTPPPLSGKWQSCRGKLNAEEGDWVVYAWHDKVSWQYAAAQVSCDVDDEDGSGTFQLLDWNGCEIDWDPLDFYMRIER